MQGSRLALSRSFHNIVGIRKLSLCLSCQFSVQSGPRNYCNMLGLDNCPGLACNSQVQATESCIP